MKAQTTLRFALFALCLILIVPMVSAAPATVFYTSSSLGWSPQMVHDGMTLTVSGPAGINERHAFGADEAAAFSIFDANGSTYPNGTYTWELRVAPKLDDQARAELEAAQVAGDEIGLNAAKERAGIADPSQFISSGSFTIAGGQILSRDVAEEGVTKAGTDDGIYTKAQVYATDLVVQGSECLGIDCTSSENFGFDTLRLKENNLRIKFEDTSASATFPGNDWQLTANDSDNGGLNKFSIDDVTGGKTPFTVEAGAPNHALYLEDDGDVGVGTSNPAVRVHMAKGDSPTLRLEQDGSSGFTPQTWDISGNETNFFIRDVTNGSLLPFRIKPKAPKNSIFVDADGDIGLGTENIDANATVHVVGNDTTTSVATDVVFMQNYGPTRFALKNKAVSDAAIWRFNHANDGKLRIGDEDMTVEFEIDRDGNVTTSGTINGVSDRNKKKDFETIDSQAVLDAVANMPMSTWSYKADSQQLRHMGPMAQDFYAAFGLGVDERHIALTDMSGVALAAIQGLQKENTELAERLAALEALIEAQSAE